MDNFPSRQCAAYDKFVATGGRPQERTTHNERRARLLKHRELFAVLSAATNSVIPSPYVYNDHLLEATLTTNTVDRIDLEQLQDLLIELAEYHPHCPVAQYLRIARDHKKTYGGDK